jgi:hypothetical protein
MKTTKTTSKKTKDRIIKAEEDFRKMQQEIAPFIKKRKSKEYLSGDQWFDTYFINILEEYC